MDDIVKEKKPLITMLTVDKMCFTFCYFKIYITALHSCSRAATAFLPDTHGADQVTLLPQTSAEEVFTRTNGVSRSTSGSSTDETDQEESKGKLCSNYCHNTIVVVVVAVVVIVVRINIL